MKKILWGILIILVIAVLIALIYNPTSTLSEEELLEIVQPDIDNYCNTLESNVVDSACPTCAFNPQKEFEILSRDSGSGETRLRVLYGLIYGRNDRPGDVEFQFTISENGNVIEKDLPLKTCL